MNYLAIIGIIGTIVAIVALILFIVRFIGAFLRTRRENAAAQEAYETRFLNITDHYAEDKARLYPRFKAHYDKLYQSLHIPGQVYRVEKCSCVFSLEHVCLGHYAWMGEEALYFFPIWEDIALYLQDPEYLHCFRDSDIQTLFGWKIPVEYLEYFETDADSGVTTAYYRDSSGGRYRTVFLAGADAFFRQHFPQQDAEVLERKRYFGSNDSIRDLRSQLVELETMRDAGQLSPGEYESRKLELIKRY